MKATLEGVAFFISMAFVYIIYSQKWDQYYVGSTEDTGQRLADHNAGRNKSTRGGAPWQLKYTEAFSDGTSARKREYQIKKKKSRKYLERLIAAAG